MSEEFKKFQNEVAKLQEQLDEIELSQVMTTAQKYTELTNQMEQISQKLKKYELKPEVSTISYRLQIQHFKGLLKHMKHTIESVKPTLDVPLEQPVSVDKLYEYYLKAMRFHLKRDDFDLDKEMFLEDVEKARLKARHYYDGEKTYVAVAADSIGPYILIKKRSA